MITQIQCPNCGCYRVSSSTRPDTRKIGQDVTRIPVRQHLMKGAKVFSALTAIGGFSIYFGIRGSGAMTEVFAPFGVFVFIFEAILLFFFVSSLFSIENGYLITRRDKTIKTKISRNSCDLCGYKWEWVEGTPKPPVTMRPDLIAAGEERQKKAAAAAYLDKQRRAKK